MPAAMSAAVADRREFTITKVHCDDAGIWRAHVTGPDGVTVPVDRRWGSWQAEVRAAPRSRTMVRKFVLPHVAKALQAKVRPLERKANENGGAQ